MTPLKTSNISSHQYILKGHSDSILFRSGRDSYNKCHQDVENLQLLPSSWQVLGGAVHYHCCQSARRAQWSDYLISVIPSVIRGYHGNWYTPVDVPLPLSPWQCRLLFIQLFYGGVFLINVFIITEPCL